MSFAVYRECPEENCGIPYHPGDSRFRQEQDGNRQFLICPDGHRHEWDGRGYRRPNVRVLAEKLSSHT